MISRLTGTIVHSDLKYVIIDVGGVGYKIHVTADTILKLEKKKNSRNAENDTEKTTLWTYLAVRDDALDLYGFHSPAELEFFELLNTISGIGPKTAIGILNVASVEALETAVQSGETSHLVKVAGLGKKMAEKIVRELQEKIEHFGRGRVRTEHDAASVKNDADAIEALKSLGYNHGEAREALKEVGKDIKETGARVKAALKILGK